MEWFTRLESRLRRYAVKKDDRDMEKKLDAAFTNAKSEKQKSEMKESVRTIAVTAIRAQDRDTIFKLKYDSNPGSRWVLQPEERRAVPHCLRSTLSDFDLAFAGADQNEALIRTRVNVILVTILAAKKKEEFGQGSQRVSTSSTASYKSLHLQVEQNVKLLWQIKKERVWISGRQDNSLWYGDAADQATNLVVLEFKKRGSEGEGCVQVLCYMAMVHHERRRAQKPNTEVWGISTDSYGWWFLHLSSASQYSRSHFEWASHSVEIVSMLHRIFESAAALSPVTTRAQEKSGKRKGLWFK